MPDILTLGAVSKYGRAIESQMPGIRATGLNVGATNNNLTISNGAMTPTNTPYAGYLLKQLTRLNLDRITFPKIYKPTNTKCQVDVCGNKTELISGAVLGVHFDENTNDFIGSTNAESNSGTFDTVNKKFGTASISYNGSQYTQYSDSDIFNVGSGDFYLDFWMKRGALTGAIQRFFGQSDPTHANANTSFYGLFDTINDCYFGVCVGSTLYSVNIGAITDTANFIHFRLGRDGGNLRVFKNGVLSGSTAITGTVNNPAYKFALGRSGEKTTELFTGNIDEFVLVKGVSPGSTNFTPPENPYGVAVVSVASDSIMFSSATSETTDFYKDDIVVVTSGTGTGQTRKITTYDGTTKIATLDQSWTTTPTTASGFVLYDGISSNISPGYDFSQIDYSATPTVNVICSLEKQVGATASPSMGVPIVTEINLNPIQSGSGTGTLSSGQLTVNVTLSRAVSLYNAKPFCDVISTSASAYTMNVTAQMTTETNLQLKFSGSNASAPFSYVWHVVEY